MTQYHRARHRRWDTLVTFPLLARWHPYPGWAIARHCWREPHVWGA